MAEVGGAHGSFIKPRRRGPGTTAEARGVRNDTEAIKAARFISRSRHLGAEVRRASFSSSIKPHVSLLDDGGASRPAFCSCCQSKEPSYDDLLAADQHRKQLLGLARSISPIDTVARLGLINRTVVPRILRRYPTWMVLLLYAGTAVSSRLGFMVFDELEPSVFDGVAQVVTFMIIFYVSYCYNRYITQFGDVEQIMRSTVNACVYNAWARTRAALLTMPCGFERPRCHAPQPCSAAVLLCCCAASFRAAADARGFARSHRRCTMARVLFDDAASLHKVWRFLNLQHCIAYCGLTES